MTETPAGRLIVKDDQQALSGEIAALVIVASPRALGEMRKHYHTALSAILNGEMAKDLTGHSMLEVKKTVLAA
ncbi:MAG: host attachment protein [Devosia sp.]